MQERIATIILVFSIGFSAMAGNPKIDKFVESQGMESASVAVYIGEGETNSVIIDFNAQKSLSSASILKLLTTATALHLWGEDYQFETLLQYDGEIDSLGTLHGNVYIKGSGDPSLGSEFIAVERNEFLNNCIKRLKEIGVKQITGSIIADCSLLDSEGVSPKWTWEDMGNYYAAGCYGINYRDNLYRLRLKSDAPGSLVSILGWEPRVDGLSFTSHLRAKANGIDSAYIYGAPLDNHRLILGSIPANQSMFTIKGDIPNPPLFLAQQLNDFLKKEGVNVAIKPKSNLGGTIPSNNNRQTIYTYNSPALIELARVTNMRSNNLYAEALLRLIALKKYPIGSTVRGMEVLLTFWKDKGINLSGLFMYDGSGLSPMNKITAKVLASVLSQSAISLTHTLPTVGEEGTVRTFMKGNKLKGKLKMKSGSMSQVSCFAGYYETAKRYSVVVLVNNYSLSRSLLNQKIGELIEGLLTDLK